VEEKDMGITKEIINEYNEISMTSPRMVGKIYKYQYG